MHTNDKRNYNFINSLNMSAHSQGDDALYGVIWPQPLRFVNSNHGGIVGNHASIMVNFVLEKGLSFIKKHEQKNSMERMISD